MQPHESSSNAPYITSQQAQQAARALSSALSNPYQTLNGNPQQDYYGQSFQYSSHYAQAYLRASSSTTMTTPDGYTLSSTYTPTAHINYRHTRGRGSFVQRGRGGQYRGGFNSGGLPGSWYEPGNHRCTYEQCTFVGSKKSLETHMMDRHLIYPPGWENRKRKPEWDADPSLNNGKPIPIQGTNVILQAPEDIDAWIAERKRRWPTNARKEEKEKKLQEAVERGEIAAVDARFRGRKRQKVDDSQPRGRGRGKERGQPRNRVSQVPGQRLVSIIDTSLPKKPPPPATPNAKIPDSDTDSEPSSGSDVDPERDAISSRPLNTDNGVIVMADVDKRIDDENIVTEQAPKPVLNIPTAQSRVQPVVRRIAPRPRPTPQNPFSNGQSLLRSLLLPEIRVTVSNLSQAIHFLVENDFLENVELNPGDADSKPIQVIGAVDAPTST